MQDPNITRRDVSADYARAVTSGTGCCGGPVPKGVVAKIAGYTNEDFAVLPVEAVVDSFGCGNPLAFSAVQPGQVVLDLGSGAGIDLLLAAGRVGPTGRAIGVDMTDEMIAKANQNIAASGLTNVEVRKGVIEDLPVESSSVDWVISNCVINLSPEKPKVFAEISRVLKPGGQMLVSDIVAGEIPAEIADNRHLYSSCLVGAISEQAYTAGLRDAGMTDVEVVDRMVYDTAQLEMFIGSELKDESSSCCGAGGVNPALARAWAERLVGKIASVRVQARKPV